MDEMQGVMALPEAQGAGMRPEDMALIEQIRQNVPRQEITQEFLAAGEQADPQAVAEFKQELAGLELTPDELNKLNTMVDAILAAPQDYASLRRAYLAEGMPEDLLPEQFDPAFFAALNMAIDTIAMNPGSPPPMAMAMGGVADLAAYGRNGDTMLAHITPQEAAMLKRMGGSGTINPYTGLPEYASIFSKIGKAAKKFAKSTVGKVIIGAALGFFVGPAAASFLGVTSTAGMAAVSGFVGGAGSTLAAGGGLKNALKAGAMSALLGGATAAISGGAAAFEPRVLGGQNPNVFGFGQPEVAPPTGVGTAAPAGGLPSLNELSTGPLGVDPYSMDVSPADIPMGADRFSPIDQAPRVISDARAFAGEIPTESLDRGFPMGSGETGRINVLREQLLKDSAEGRFGAPGAGDLGQFAGPAGGPPLDTGNLRPDELTGGVARNTGSGTYSPQGKFTPSAVAGTGQQAGGGVMDLIRQGEYGKAASAAYDQIMPKGLGGGRGVVTPGMIEAAMPDAEKLVTALRPDLSYGSPEFSRLASAQALKMATPSMLSTYGPLAALGIGALGLSGGFRTKDVQMPDLFKGPTGFQLARMYPSMYGLQYGGVRPTAYGGMYLTPPGYAEGGGVMDTPQAMRVGGKTYPRKIGAINGPGTGTSDSIPAMLSDGEFVFTAKAVRAMGQGSRRKGAKKMYKLMKMLEGKAA